MRRLLIGIVAFGIALTALPASRTLVGDDVDGPITLGLWQALESVWPERLTARARWVVDPDAIFETPVVKESDRIGVQQLVSCTRRGRWMCALSHQELHIEANGVRHRTRVRGVERDVVLTIVDYMYSDCFYAQQKERALKAPFPRPYPRDAIYNRPIYDIAALRDGVFEVATGMARYGAMFTIEADPDNEKGCAFQLRSARTWQGWPYL